MLIMVSKCLLHPTRSLPETFPQNVTPLGEFGVTIFKSYSNKNLPVGLHFWTHRKTWRNWVCENLNYSACVLASRTCISTFLYKHILVLIPDRLTILHVNNPSWHAFAVIVWRFELEVMRNKKTDSTIGIPIDKKLLSTINKNAYW